MTESIRTGGDDLTMTPSEWLEHAADIADRWPHAALPEATLTKWGADLADLDSAQVGAAIEALYRDGREYPPNPGVIRAKLAELKLDPPTWPEVYGSLQRIAKLPERMMANAREVEEEGEIRVAYDEVRPQDEAVAEAHPMLRAFIEEAGLDQVWQGAHPQASGSDEARLRDKWLAFARALIRDNAYHGMPDAGLPALRRVNREPRALGEGVGAVRRQLEAGRPTEEAA
jgi:hypothetical protein